MVRVLFSIVFVAVVLVFGHGPTAAAQQGDVAAAANAFGEAQRAELNGDHARAAEFYELADRIAPAPEALRNAARSWLSANRNVAAASAAEELLRRYGADAPSKELADQILGRTRPTLTRLAVECSEPCTLSVNGLAATTEARPTHVVYVEPGAQTVTARFESGSASSIRVLGKAGDATALTLAPEPGAQPVAAPAPPPAGSAQAASPAEPTIESGGARASSGISPVYFWVGTGLTLALGGVTLWSGLDLLKARDDFEKDATPSRKDFEAGEDKDLRTTILIASTASVAVATGVLAFFTNFSKKPTEARVRTSGRLRAAQSVPFSFGAGRHGAQLGFRGTF